MSVKNLSNKWSKATVIGTMWAASEIVLGSFLHNLKIPFSSTILTGIGIMLLVSISAIWKEKGLFWRAGLICAVMKTVSPSAVIFGPMIAIFMQSVLMEISVRALGKNTLGFVLGAILASSWNVFQKIFNLLLFYGSNLIDVYTELVNSAQDQLNLKFNAVWLPIIILLGIYILAGIISVFIGKRIGKKIRSETVQQTKSVPRFNISTENNPNFDYSFKWLALNLVLIIGAFLLIYRSPFYIWLPVLGLIILLWTSRYKRSVKKLLNPKFWIYFLIVTMLVAVVFAKIRDHSLQEALLIGLQMNGRAILLILGLSAIGKELYHPKIRDYFAKTYFKELPLALEIGFNHLPQTVARMPAVKQLFRNPVNVMAQVIAGADSQLQSVRNYEQQPVMIITGGVAQGKTTLLRQLVEILKKRNIKIGGFYAERIMEDGMTMGYQLVNCDTGEVVDFLSTDANSGTETIGKFYINTKSLEQGREWLEKAKHYDLMAIDEIGKLELQGRGWAAAFSELLAQQVPLVICARDSFINEILDAFDLKNAMEFEVDETAAEEMAAMIIKKLQL